MSEPEPDRVEVRNGLLTNIHAATACSSNIGGCWIHAPRPHPLSAAPIVWREDKGTAERQCPHGLGHPDLQDAAYWWLEHHRDVTIHACDGCCGPLPAWAIAILPDRQRADEASTITPEIRNLPGYHQLLALAAAYQWPEISLIQWLNSPTTYLDYGEGAQRPIDLLRDNAPLILSVAETAWSVEW